MAGVREALAAAQQMKGMNRAGRNLCRLAVGGFVSAETKPLTTYSVGFFQAGRHIGIIAAAGVIVPA